MIFLLAMVAALASVCILATATFPIVSRRPALVVILLCASFPFGLHDVGLGLKLVQLAALGFIAIVAFVRLSAGASPLGWARILWGPLALVALALLSTPGSIDQGLAERQDTALVLGLLVIFAVVGAIRSMSDVRMVLLAFLVVGDLICLSGVIGARSFSVQFTSAVANDRAHGMFSEPNAFGSFSAAVLCVALGLLLTPQPRRVRAAAGVSAAISATAVSLSLSRGAFIGTSLAILALAVLLPRIRWRILGTAAVLGGCLFIFSGWHTGPVQVQVFATRITSMLSARDSPNDKRTAAWREALREIEARPLLGFGPNAFPEASAGADGIGSAGTDFPGLDHPVGIDHAHNVILTVAAELGLVAAFALVAFSLALGLRLKRAIRRMPPPDAGVVVACAAGLSSFVGHGLVDYTLRNAMIMIPLCLLTASAVASTFVHVSNGGGVKSSRASLAIDGARVA